MVQHYTKFEGGFEPFINYEIVEYKFEGYLADEQYMEILIHFMYGMIL
ncbi:hypothetical protein [Clostridium sp. HBUAS56010]|nr:hypothetical protein [Clostridium sp. HBUAS56010]